jgi:SOS-response transcriptional repressor LexA
MPKDPSERKIPPLTKPQQMVLDAIRYFLRKGEVPTVREVGALIGLRSPATVLKHLRALEKEKLISLSGKSRGIRLAVISSFAQPHLAPREAAMLQHGTLKNGEPLDESSQGGSFQAGAFQAGAFHDGTLQDQRKSLLQQSRDSLVSRGPLDMTTQRVLSFPRIPGAARFPGVPVVGAIAAGKPFESYQESSSDGNPNQGTPQITIDPRMFNESGEILALQVHGDSMMQAGILDGDYAIIRRQNTVEEGEIAAVIINGEGTLKRWHTRSCQGKKTVSLHPANEHFDPIDITEESAKDVLVFGKYVGLVRGNLRFA